MRKASDGSITDGLDSGTPSLAAGEERERSRPCQRSDSYQPEGAPVYCSITLLNPVSPMSHIFSADVIPAPHPTCHDTFADILPAASLSSTFSTTGSGVIPGGTKRLFSVFNARTSNSSTALLLDDSVVEVSDQQAAYPLSPSRTASSKRRRAGIG